MIIVRKYPSHQKNYSKVSDLINIGKDKIKKAVKDALIKKRSKLSDSQKVLKERRNKLEDETASNKSLTNKLIKEAKANKIAVFKNNEFNRAVRDQFVRDYEKSSGRKLIRKPKADENTIILNIDDKTKKDALDELKSIKELTKTERNLRGAFIKYDDVINISGGNINKKSPIIAHEIGHKLNRNSPLTKLISNTNNKLKDNTKDSKSKLKVIGRKIATRLIEPIEEQNAWNNGIKLMKKHGASKEEIKHAKKLAKTAVKNYKNVDSSEIYGSILDNLN